MLLTPTSGEPATKLGRIRPKSIAGSEQRAGDGGSVLMLMPAAVLVVIILGSIAVDFAVVFLAQRELAVTAAAAANDAATYGVDADHYRQTGNYRLDRDRVRAAVRSTLVAKRLCGEVQGDVVIAGNAVTVHFTRRVDYIFAKAIPGVAHDAAVEASDRAEPAGAPGPGGDIASSFEVAC